MKICLKSFGQNTCDKHPGEQTDEQTGRRTDIWCAVRLCISRGKKVSKQTSEISLQESVTTWSSVSLMYMGGYDLVCTRVTARRIANR